MVEQTSPWSGVAGLQAGREAAAMLEDNLSTSDRAVRTIGWQLAVIGDQLVRDRTARLPDQWPRPAQALTRTIYRQIQRPVWDLQGLSATVKTWLAAAGPGQGGSRVDAWLAWASGVQLVNCTVWIARALVTVAAVTTVTVCTALWVEWRG